VLSIFLIVFSRTRANTHGNESSHLYIYFLRAHMRLYDVCAIFNQMSREAMPRGARRERLYERRARARSESLQRR